MKAAEQTHRTKGLLRLTMACNERCPFCNVPVEDYPRPTPPDAQIAAELDAFVASGEQTLTLSGGEPTLLRRRLLAVTAEARTRGIPYVELQTNAVLIDEGYAQALAAAGVTSAFVSLLSDQPALHDALAGLPGAFPRCLAGVDALIAAGVRVTLNPVIARSTQDRVADYVDFVAARLPAVRSISVSAVQPHGRAATPEALEALLPDYDVLARVLPEARARARAHGIELLNPYCGLPLCVGWADDPARCVEAQEAELGGWRPTPGVENTGDKQHGPPCGRCAWRTRCGGAWRITWTARGGRGISPPSQISDPWSPEGPGPAEARLIAPGAPDAAAFAALAAAAAPTVWLWTAALRPGDADRLLQSGCTDLALDLDPTGLAAGAAPRGLALTLRELRALLAGTAGAPPAGRLRVHLRLGGGDRADQAAAVAWATRAGVDRVLRRRPGSAALDQPAHVKVAEPALPSSS